MFDRFSDPSREWMNLARQEAQRLKHAYLGTEHILLGLAAMDGGGAAEVLKQRGLDGGRIRAAVEAIVRPGAARSGSAQIPFTPRAKQVLELSMEEAARLGHRRIGTEHLLLGLLAEREGIAAVVLNELGLRLDDLRSDVSERIARHDTTET